MLKKEKLPPTLQQLKIGQRIDEAISSLGRGGKAEVARQGFNKEGHKGIKPQSVSEWVKTGRISKENLLMLENVTHYRSEWILLGLGDKQLAGDYIENEVIKPGLLTGRQNKLTNSQKTKIVSNTRHLAHTSWTQINNLQSPLNETLEIREVNIDLTSLKRPFGKNCYVIILDTDAFAGHNLHRRDRLLINPDLLPDEQCTVLIEIKPGNRLTLAEYRVLGDKAFITVMENGYSQMSASEIEFEVKGLLIACWPRQRNY